MGIWYLSASYGCRIKKKQQPNKKIRQLIPENYSEIHCQRVRKAVQRHHGSVPWEGAEHRWVCGDQGSNKVIKHHRSDLWKYSYQMMSTTSINLLKSVQAQYLPLLYIILTKVSMNCFLPTLLAFGEPKSELFSVLFSFQIFRVRGCGACKPSKSHLLW